MHIILAYLWQYMSNPKAMIALSLFIALLSTYSVLPRKIFWILVVSYALSVIAYVIYWLIQRKQHAEQGEKLAHAIEQSHQAVSTQYKDKAELQSIQQQVKESIQLIRKSKLGDKKGNAALYELPWYMVIGNPAAGKSSAIYNSGLKFPFEETHQKMVSAGLSGTRSCDWFFSTQGVLLDTAGRYSVYAEDHAEWLGFLNILKKSRAKAPVNGLIVIVSIAELISQSPEHSLKLAKNLRARIQDLTERLEVVVPVYLVFSKMDLIAGFTEFFNCYAAQEYNQAWGATLPYEQNSSQHAVTLFEKHYNILYDGLKSVSTTHLSRRHAQNISPSVMTFPLEFKTLKPALKSFIGTLFEDNPYQFQPVFRGFYFTSALQECSIESPMTESIAQEFQLQQLASPFQDEEKSSIAPNHGYFLQGLFSNVILRDQHLVKQHINPAKKRQRYMAFTAALLGVGLLLSVWVWSYRHNQQLIADVQADLDQVIRLEKTFGQVLSTQLESLLILQARLQQLDGFSEQRPLKFSFGLYQGKKLREQLKVEYLKGVQQIVLLPTQQNIAQYLQRVQQDAATLKAHHIHAKTQQVAKTQPYLEPSVQNPQDAYNALKAYLMLTNPEYRESSHLSDQISRFWRTWLDAHRGEMPRTDMIQQAEKILSYAMTLAHQDDFPVLESDAQMVDQTRQVLLSVIQGMPARDRVYNEIKMRAAVRFPALTVSQIVGEQHSRIVLGSHALPGIFTQQAWNEYVEQAIDQVANQPTDSKDWVLNSHQSDDLTFSGSPEQIRKQLLSLYQQEYVSEWKKFLNGIHYAKTDQFNQQVKQLDLLGEPQNSPIRKLLQRIAVETNWDNPIVQAELAVPEQGFMAWFKDKVLRQSNDKAAAQAALKAQGAISQEYQMFYQLLRKRDDLQDQSLFDVYMNNLAQVRSKLNDLQTAGEIGPSAMALFKQTIHDQNSVFNTTQKYVDEKMMVGLKEADQQLLQKLLMTPLTQSFASLIVPTQDEINKLWRIQAYQPFATHLGQKYPFHSGGTLQATSQEMGQIFGETGSIAGFVKDTLDPLLIRRGYVLTSKTWKDLGLNLNPQFVMAFPQYVAPIHGMATGRLDQPATSAVSNQSNFQFYPLQHPQFLSYSIDIDGQRMQFENGIQQWVNFVWPNPGAIPGVRISAVDLNGQSHTIFEAPGEYGINRLIDAAQRKEQNGHFEMTWVSKTEPSLSLKVNFRLISGHSSGNIGSSRGYVGLQLVDQVTTTKALLVVAAQTTAMSPAQTAATQSKTTMSAQVGGVPQ